MYINMPRIGTARLIRLALRPERLRRPRRRAPMRQHWLWMTLCCLPMIAVAVVIALGFWSWR